MSACSRSSRWALARVRAPAQRIAASAWAPAVARRRAARRRRSPRPPASSSVWRPPVRSCEPTRAADASTPSVVFVDVSLSMRAAPGRRRRRASTAPATAVQQLRAAVPDVPAGVSGLTDRALPYLFPTSTPGRLRGHGEAERSPERAAAAGRGHIASTFSPRCRARPQRVLLSGRAEPDVRVRHRRRGATSSDRHRRLRECRPEPRDGGRGRVDRRRRVVRPRRERCGSRRAPWLPVDLVSVGSTADRLYLGSRRAEPRTGRRGGGHELERSAEPAGGAATRRPTRRRGEAPPPTPGAAR